MNLKSLTNNIPILLTLLVVLLPGCAGLPESYEMADWPAEKIYAEGKEAFDDKRYSKAVEIYERLEARYPYGRLTEQAQLELAYAYWKQFEPGSGLATIDRFLRLHPNHPAADYALYLRGLINFNIDNSSLISKMGAQDVADRDPKSTRASFEAFRELVSRYPDSRYRDDATQRMTYLVNALARSEIKVARYYMKRGAWLAAANRAQHAIKTYPESPANEEALLIMVQAYDKLGLSRLRDDANRVMKNNFPNSRYLKKGDDDDGASDSEPWWKFW